MFYIIRVFIASITLIALSSCLYMSQKQKVDYDESKVTKIRFENSEAKKIFYKTVKVKNLSKLSKHSEFVEKDNLIIPFLVFKSHINFNKTAFLNKKIEEADANSNGVITLKEVKKFRSSQYKYHIKAVKSY